MADWRNVVLLTLRETPSKKEGKKDEGYGTWIVARVKPDNTLFNVTYRSGRYYPNKLTGEKELPKDGIGYYDFMELKKESKKLTAAVRACACGATRAPTVWDEVVALLDPRHPPVLPPPDAPPPATAEPEIEKMPW